MHGSRAWSPLRLGLLAVPAAGALFTIALLAWAGSDDASVPHLFALVGFSAWAASPYALLAFAGLRLRRPARQWVVLAGAVLLTGAAIAILTVGFVLKADAQSALLFLFVPLYQWVGCGVVFALAGLVGMLADRRRRA